MGTAELVLQDFAEAVRTYEAMVGAYRDFGYALIELPRFPVAERMRFIVQNLPDGK